MHIAWNKKDILIIEDSYAAAKKLEGFLRKLGYQNIHTCYDGKQGMKKFLELSESNRLPIVFLDYYLPDIHADMVFDHILEIKPETRIIIATAAGKEEDGIQYLSRHGAYHYLQKPISFKNMESMINTIEEEVNPITPRTAIPIDTPEPKG